MGFLRRFLSVGLGLAAGAAAYKIMSDYDRDNHIDAEFVDITPPQAAAEPEEAPEAEAPVQQPEEPERVQPEQPVWHPAAGPDSPNHNPVTNQPAPERPIMENGKLDPMKIASPEDFEDWDDLGCKS